jgi:hypothetical protein
MKPIAIALAMGLTLANSAQARDNLPEITVIKTENQRWHFRQVTVDHADKGLTVFGRMNAHLRYGLPRGHVDIAAWSADNKLLAETTTDYSPRLLTKRASRKGGVRFSAKLPMLPANAQIKIAFHRDEPQKRQNPAHDQTVAH